MFFYVVCNISYYIYVTLVCCVRGAYSLRINANIWLLLAI